ncbi:hypothetical protein D3C85_1218810 [compost metagenome]
MTGHIALNHIFVCSGRNQVPLLVNRIADRILNYICSHGLGSSRDVNGFIAIGIYNHIGASLCIKFPFLSISGTAGCLYKKSAIGCAVVLQCQIKTTGCIFYFVPGAAGDS